MKLPNTMISFNNEAKNEPYLTSLKSKWYIKYSFSPNFLLRILYWTGLLKNSGRRYMTVCFFLIAYILISMGISEETLDLNDNVLSRVAMLFVGICLLSFFVWHSMRSRAKLLSKLLWKIYPFSLTKWQTFWLFLVFASPIIMAVVEVAKSERLSRVKNIAFELHYYWKVTISIIHLYMTYLIYPSWANIVAFLYCLVCQRISAMLSHLTARIRNYSPKEFTAIKQKDILKQQSRLADVVQLTQIVFSVPSFLISLASFSGCMTVIAILVHILFHDIGYAYLIQWIFMIAHSFGGLITLVWMAGKLPLEAEVLHMEFRKKIRQRLLSLDKCDEIRFENELVESSNFALSGCGIVYFQRSSIAALAGTILTFAILFISKG